MDRDAQRLTAAVLENLLLSTYNKILHSFWLNFVTVIIAFCIKELIESTCGSMEKNKLYLMVFLSLYEPAAEWLLSVEHHQQSHDDQTEGSTGH